MTSSKPNWKKSSSNTNAEVIARLLTIDTRLSEQLSLPPESSRWRWAGRIAHLGDGSYVFGGLGLIYGLGWLWNQTLLCQADLIIGLLILATAALVTLIKFGVRRRRPQPPGKFVSFQYDAYSFPSGHAARLATLAIGAMFFDSLLGWILLGLAVSVAAARVMVGIHYVSDIVIGLGLGGLVAWAGLTLLPYLA